MINEKFRVRSSGFKVQLKSIFYLISNLNSELRTPNLELQTLNFEP